MPRFSIIIPVYNCAAYLPQCLDSLLGQTFTDLEIIAVDDGSKDNSREIGRAYAARHSDKLRFLEHPVNKGPGGARNTGINAATGEYLMFADSDDYLREDALALLDALIRRENADIVEFDHAVVDENGGFISRTHHEKDIPPLARTVTIWNKAFRRELFASVRFPEGRSFGEDYCTIPKLLMSAGRICVLNEPLYSYRQLSTSLVHGANIEKNRDMIYCSDELIRYCRENHGDRDTLLALEHLTVCHVMYHAVLRVNGIDRKSDLQHTLKAYVEDQFPNWRQNPHHDLFSPRQKQLLTLIEQERWSALYIRYHLRNRVTGLIKRIIRKLKGNH